MSHSVWEASSRELSTRTVVQLAYGTRWLTLQRSSQGPARTTLARPKPWHWLVSTWKKRCLFLHTKGTVCSPSHVPVGLRVSRGSTRWQPYEDPAQASGSCGWWSKSVCMCVHLQVCVCVYVLCWGKRGLPKATQPSQANTLHEMKGTACLPQLLIKHHNWTFSWLLEDIQSPFSPLSLLISPTPSDDTLFFPERYQSPPIE